MDDFQRLNSMRLLLESQNRFLCRLAAHIGVAEAEIDRFADDNHEAWKEFWGHKETR